jgi:hypothetical protein
VGKYSKKSLFQEFFKIEALTRGSKLHRASFLETLYQRSVNGSHERIHNPSPVSSHSLAHSLENREATHDRGESCEIMNTFRV